MLESLFKRAIIEKINCFNGKNKQQQSNRQRNKRGQKKQHNNINNNKKKLKLLYLSFSAVKYLVHDSIRYVKEGIYLSVDTRRKLNLHQT